MNRRAALLSIAGLLPAMAAMARPARRADLGPNADLGGDRLLPPDNPWHWDISGAAVDPASSRILARIGLATTLHPDFGTEWEGAPIGIPYVVVPGNQPRVPITFKDAAESDPGPYPIPPDAPIEGGPNGTGDRHILVVDRDNWILWEVFNAFPDGRGGWRADSGAIWDLKQNQMRPPGWTSADAAGLPILPGLVRYDEVGGAGIIRHALRFTVERTRRAYLPPASHWASDDRSEDLLPMGARVRLKAGFDVRGLSAEALIILAALKTYGMVVADNGSNLFISGAPDQRWNTTALRDLKRVKASDLEVVSLHGLVTDRPR